MLLPPGGQEPIGGQDKRSTLLSRIGAVVKQLLPIDTQVTVATYEVPKLQASVQKELPCSKNNIMSQSYGLDLAPGQVIPPYGPCLKSLPVVNSVEMVEV